MAKDVSMAKGPAETAIDLQAKFEYYFLGLIFAVLALSIQTAKFGQHHVADLFELLGWLLLFVSGVVGIFRGEWIPVVYRIEAKLQQTRHEIEQIQGALQNGVELQVTFIDNGQQHMLAGQAAINKYQAVVAVLEEQSKDAEGRIISRYWWMKWAFMVGIGCLIVSRAYGPVINLQPVVQRFFN